MIEVEGLTKYYGRLPAIRDVNFRIGTGEIVGFLGPNGAGKTTTMRILTCFSPASSGTVRVLGMDVNEESRNIRKKIGYVPENVPLYDWMRVASYLRFVARAKDVPAADQEREIERVTAATATTHVMGTMIRALSKGYKQRVGLAQALIGDPPVLVLDEPTIGLDPKQIKEIRELIKGFSSNRTVILSTHILPEVSQVCDRVIIINKGSIVAEDSPSNLVRTHGKGGRCRIVVKANRAEVAPVFSSLNGVTGVRLESEPTDNNGEVAALVESDVDIDVRPLLSRTAVEKGWDLLELKSLDWSLEDVFIDLVTEEPQEHVVTDEPKEATQ